MIETTKATPEATFAVTINSDIKKNKDKSAFIKVKPGYFKINSSYDPTLYKNTPAQKFEEKIKKFMGDLEFNNVKGGSDNIMIGYPHEHQIDVIAAWGNSVFVLECKSAKDFKTKNLKSHLYELKGKIPEIEEGLKKHPVYSKYNNYRYILVVNSKVTLRPADKEYANTKPYIYLWNEDFLRYYNDLYEYLKPYAKFDLLGEMGIRPLDQEPIRIPAFRTKFGDVNIYNFVINPKDLLEVAFVARRERGDERFYQRIIDKKRLGKIKKYIDSDGKFPNNIIIAFKQNSNIKFRHKLNSQKASLTGEWRWPGVEFGVLEFPKDYRSCWIIDGQHRLYAFIDSKKYFNMPITAFEHLGIEDQCRFFLDINKNQKPVDADLLWDLNGEMIPSEKDGIISNVVKKLNNKGPLFYKIYIPSSGIKKKRDSLKLSALCIAIKKRRLIERSTNGKNLNALYQDDIPRRVEYVSESISDFFYCLNNVLGNNWDLGQKGFVLSNGGISVMIGLFQKILERTIEKDGKKPVKDDIEYYLNPLKEIFDRDYGTNESLRKLRLRCTSEGGKKEVLGELILSIREKTEDEFFGGKIESSSSKEFTELETKLKKFVNDVMVENLGENWMEKIPQQDIYQRCLKYLKKHNLEGKRKPYTQLTLGPLTAIIKQFKDIFYSIFVDEDSAFGTNAEFDGAIAQILRVRNTQNSHNVCVSTRKGDETKLRLNMDSIYSCIDQYYS